MQRDKTFGGLLGGTFALIGRNAVPIALFVAVLGGLNAVGLVLGYVDESDTLAGFGFGFDVDPAEGLIASLFQLCAAVLSVAAAYFLLAKFLETEGRLPDRSTRIWAYVGVMILATLGMIGGLLLLVVPGVILLVRWSATSGYLIERRLGVIDCFKGSWDATRGSSWPIFFAGLVLFIGLVIAGGIVGGIGYAVSSELVTAIISSVLESAGNAAFLAFGIAVYLAVEDDSGAISDVFE